MTKAHKSLDDMDAVLGVMAEQVCSKSWCEPLNATQMGETYGLQRLREHVLQVRDVLLRRGLNKNKELVRSAEALEQKRMKLQANECVPRWLFVLTLTRHSQSSCRARASAGPKGSHYDASSQRLEELELQKTGSGVLQSSCGTVSPRGLRLHRSHTPVHLDATGPPARRQSDCHGCCFFFTEWTQAGVFCVVYLHKASGIGRPNAPRDPTVEVRQFTNVALRPGDTAEGIIGKVCRWASNRNLEVDSPSRVSCCTRLT